MKRFLLLFAMLATFILGSTATASAAEKIELDMTPREPIAVFIQLDPKGVGKPLEISEEMYGKIKEKLNSAHKEPMPYTKAQKDLKIYIRDNDLNGNQRDQDDGVILRSKDFKALAEKEQTRYVISIATRVTSSEVKLNFWTGIRKNLTIVTNVVVYDAEANDYLIDEDFSSVGRTSGSYDRAFHRAIEDILTKIDFNTMLT